MGSVQRAEGEKCTYITNQIVMLLKMPVDTKKAVKVEHVGKTGKARKVGEMRGRVDRRNWEGRERGR